MTSKDNEPSLQATNVNGSAGVDCQNSEVKDHAWVAQVNCIQLVDADKKLGSETFGFFDINCISF